MPTVLPEKHSSVSGQTNATKPQELSFSSSLLGSIYAVGFASRWQATPGRGPGRPQRSLVATLGYQAPGSPPNQQKGLPAAPRPSPPRVPLGAGSTVRRWAMASRRSAQAAWRHLVPTPALWGRALRSAPRWPLCPEKHFYIKI